MKVRRGFLVGIASLVVATAMAGAVPGQAQAAGADGPTEVATLEAPAFTPAAVDAPLVAGTTGFLHQQQGISGYVWTDYASGTDTPVPALVNLPLATTNFMSAGGDLVAYQVVGTTTLTVGSATGTWTSYTLPQADAATRPYNTAVAGVGVKGTRAMVEEGDGPHLLQLNADGTVTDLQIAGLPDSAAYTNTWTGLQGPGDVGLVRSTPKTGNVSKIDISLVRTDTAAAVPVPADPSLTWGASLSGGYLVSPNGTGYSLLNVADLLAGIPSPHVQVAVPSDIRDHAIVGHQFLMLTGGGSGRLTELTSVPLDGGPATRIDSVVSGSSKSPERLTQGVGGVLTVGGSATSQAVQRFSAAADGSLTTAIVRPFPAITERTATLSMAYGQVRQVVTVAQSGVPTRFGLATTPLAGASTGSAPYGTGPAWTDYWHAQPGPCAVDATCVREADGNQYGPVYVTPSATGATVNVDGAPSGTGAMGYTDPTTTVVSADNEFVLVNAQGKQWLWVPGQHGELAIGAITGAALSQGTLWRATAAGQIQSFAPSPYLPGMPAPLRTVRTGDACTASEVQVVQQWLYWSCGSSGPAGVYDLSDNAQIQVAAGPVLLGDGFLVRHDQQYGRLVMTDFHTDTAVSYSTLATLPQGSVADDRGITWTVDRTSGEVAYATADNVVHVLATGVPASAPTAVVQAGKGVVVSYQPFQLSAMANRPLASWRLTVTRAATGKVVHVGTGGPTPAQFEASWDGTYDDPTLLPDSKLPYDGSYDWTLAVTPADNPTGPATVVAAGGLGLADGTMAFHSNDDVAQSSLYGIVGRGNAHYRVGTGIVYQGDLQGSYRNLGPEHSWSFGSGTSQVNDLLLFGDLDGTGSNGVLERDGNGELYYWPGHESDWTIGLNYKDALGGGWNIYDRLVSVGDINGDGHDDLLARDRSGRLWLYPGTGHGNFGHRVLLGGGWNAYTQITGVGDINGDGAGDLLAVDTHGRLWRYFGNGHGSFGRRVELGSGFDRYNLILGVGDLFDRGHNSFVARDRSGGLWRFDSLPGGGFADRVRLGGGWNMYAGLY